MIQKHAASHLHYDFRLESAGVLKSWAVPKGPSNDPHVKRLAMQTEDHPLTYASFEGVIPAGEYGGGNVIVWDRGHYINETRQNGKVISLSEGIERGHITFTLEGEKLRGQFALLRIHSGPKPQWLLVKAQDRYAGSQDPVMERPESVVSGKKVEEISRVKNHKVWHSNRTEKKDVQAPKAESTSRPEKSSTLLSDHSALPAFVEPMLATLVDEPFSRAGWLYEPKLDGQRCLAFRSGSNIHLFSRSQQPLNVTYPEIVKALTQKHATSFVLDGEVVAFESDSDVPSFRLLQQRMHLHTAPEVARSPVKVVFILFDVLFWNGQDLRKLPLSRRKKILSESVKTSDLIQINPVVETPGDQYFKAACHRHWEGIMAKRADSTYTSGRSRDWVKMKCLNEQEFVIGGYSDPQGARDRFGALLLGYYEKDELHFAGKVGTGFDSKTLALVGQKMKPLERTTSPFTSVDLPRRGLHWVEPTLVAEVAFAEWTEDGKLRHGRFLGLRDDKQAKEIGRERPVDKSKVAKVHPLKVSESKASAATRKGPAGPNANTFNVENKSISVSNLNKVLYPKRGFTKAQVLDYYIKIAPVLLPHLYKRPLTLKRYPNGVEESFFYEKQAPSYRPSWMDTYEMRDPKTEKTTRYCLVNDLPSLLWIENLASLELHTLLSRAPDVDRPTMVAIDLDPGAPADMIDCIRVGLRLRQALDQLKLKSFVKTSGGKGLHVYIPLNTAIDYESSQGFAHGLAIFLENQNPKEVVSNMRRELRQGKVLVDWSQNSRHKTTVTAYSLRAQPTPTVSCPVSWDEVEEVAKHRDSRHLLFSPEQVLDRVSRFGDLFAPIQTLKQKLPRFDVPVRKEN